MTWINEIERLCESGLMDSRVLIGKEVPRMASVIRELVEGLQILKELTLQEEYRMTDDQSVDMKNFFDYLSPDAKEVIDDCTAPSST